VGPVRMGWRIEDVIVIGERIMERRWKVGRESLYRLDEDGFRGDRGIVPCTNLTILKSYVTHPQ